MYLVTNEKEECVGCRACVDICPKQCVHMEEDHEGFVYPTIDKDKCVACHLCEKVCPVNFANYCKKNDQTAYVGLHKDSQVCFNSSSGGAFTALYETLIDDGYRVYGVKWSKNHKVIHSVADTKKDCEQFRKSKYILSDTNHCFEDILTELQIQNKILFTGTPCQCAALYQFLTLRKCDMSNIVLMDIICHGAPNQKVFDMYMNESDTTIFEFRFKNKIPYCGAVNSRSAQVTYSDGSSKIVHSKNDPFMKGYYGRLFYRPSCAKCQYARIERVSDITIGDAWGIESVYPQYDALSGVSLLIINTQKGNAVFERMKGLMKLNSVEIDWAQKANAQLNKPTQMHTGRAAFFAGLDKYGFSKAVEKAMQVPLWRKCIRTAKKFCGGG